MTSLDRVSRQNLIQQGTLKVIIVVEYVLHIIMSVCLSGTFVTP